MARGTRTGRMRDVLGARWLGIRRWPRALAAIGTASGFAACAFGVDLDALSRCRDSSTGTCADVTVTVADGSADERDAFAAPPCPNGRGPTMRRVPEDGGCIDVTEVRVGDYAAFLATSATVPSDGRATACKSRATFVPKQGWPPSPGTEDDPVTGVDFCEAQAFCLWAGKTLCGDVAGGPLAPRALGDPTLDAWTRSCGADGRAFPYGSTYDPLACNGVDRDAGGTVRVGTLDGCTGSVGGPFDLSGNVWEWVDSCEADEGDSDVCYVRGGAFNAPAAELGCPSRRAQARAQGDVVTGFRCCAP